MSAQIANLQSDLSHVTLDWEHVTVQLSHMTSLVDSESGFLNSTTEIVVSDIVALSTQDGQVKERAALTQAINNKRRSQIQVCVCVCVCVCVWKKEYTQVHTGVGEIVSAVPTIDSKRNAHILITLLRHLA